MVEYDSRLNARNAALGIKIENLRHVLGKIEHDGNIAALSGKGRPSAAAKNRYAVFAAGGDSGDYIVIVAWDNNANRNLTIVRAVGRIECAATVVESHFAGDVTPKG